MAVYEELGRFEDAAQIATEQPFYGRPVDGKALLRASETGGRTGVLARAARGAGRRGRAWRRRRFTTVRGDLHPLGEREKAIDHLDQLVTAKTGNAVFARPAVAAHAPVGAALPGHHPAAGCAHGFSTAYSADMIGTGTPARSARRTTAPCSASTSIRLPCDKSISSDERIVPGIAADVGRDAVDDPRRHRHSLGPRQPLDLAAGVQELRCG